MERMKRKGYVGFLIMIIICLVMVLPSFVYANVTIEGGTTAVEVDLEGINNGTVADPAFTTHSGSGHNAYVTADGLVVTGDPAALWASVNGWSINIASGIVGPKVSGNAYGVIFNTASGGSGDYLSGTLTNYGGIRGSNIGVGMGYGTINNYSRIEGMANSGIYMTGAGSKTITNNAGGSIDGNTHGVYILGSSTYTSSVYIINAGDITAANLDGINIESNTGTVQITNSASGTITSTGVDGIDIENTGSTTVTNNGEITSSGNGIYAFTTGTLQVTNSASGTITSTDSSGIYLENTGSTSVINSGDIESDSEGIYIDNQGTTEVINTVGGSITSSTYAGMNILSTGNTTVTNSGEIDADHYGIYVDSEGTTNVTNSGRITAANDTGIHLQNSTSTGNTTITNALGGIITANNGYGIYVSVYSDLVTVTNNGTITSYGDGIYVYPYSATVTNNGMITSTGGSGIYIYDAGVGTSTVTNNGQIDANQYGIYVENDGPVTVTNTGTILATNLQGIYVYQDSEGPVTVTNSGYISASNNYGIYVDGDGTTNVTNSGIITGTSNGYGIYVENTGTTNVRNSSQIMVYYEGIEIYTTGTTNVINSGLIQSEDDYGIYVENDGNTNVTNSGTIMSYNEGIYIENDVTGITNVTNTLGGSIMSHNDSSIDITNTGTTIVTNSGLLMSEDDYGIDIDNTGTTTLTNSSSGVINSYYGIYITSTGTVNMTNRGLILAQYEGVDIYNTGDTTVTNSGTIMSENDYGLYIDNTGTANVTNSGQIISHDQGMYIDNTGTANVTNSGQIMSEDNYGIYISPTGTTSVTNVTNSGTIMGHYDGIRIYGEGMTTVNNSGTITGTDGAGVWIRAESNGASVNVTNSGTINSTDSSGVRIYVHDANSTATLTNTAAGNIYGHGVEMVIANSTSTGAITNSGIIMSEGDGIDVTGYGEKTITNNAGGVISGEVYGIRVIDGHTAIINHGTIIGADGTAIRVNRAGNSVTLGTGSVIIGDIRSNYDYETPIFLDGHGTIGADQIQQFASLNKTGSGTWTLTGDMDYESSYNYNGHSITVESGVLALAARGSIGGGVVTRDFTQMPGASLGFVVTPTGDTGALTVTGATTADFNNGTIVVIPTAGHYAKTTTYENVLTADSIVNPWTNVKGTAFLKPYLVEDADWIHFDGNESYDLVLNRLSFAKGAVSSNNSSVGGALDGMYEDATGDMRDILDHLVVLSPGAAQDALTQMGGGTHTALQFMSFEGLNKYHWALNNHLGGGSGFTGGSGLAGYQNGYPQGLQTAMAAGGTSMSDAAPMLLAAVGNLGTVASGTKWDLWADGYYSKGDRSSADVISRYNSTLYGGLMGFDYRLTDKLLIGISAGISQNDVEFENLMDKGEVESYQGSVYTYYDAKPWYVEGVLTYAANTYTMDRVITIGDMTRVANSEYNGDEYAGYAEVGYKLDAGGIVMIRPMVAFQAAYLMQDGYTETGAGDLNLVVDERDTGSYQSYLGVNISKAITMGNFVLTPEARAKWAHEFSSDDHLINAKFSGAGSGSFTVAADRPSRDTAILGLGLNGRFNKNLSMYIQYDAELNSDYTNHTGMMGLRFAW